MSNETNFQEQALEAMRRRTASRPRFGIDPDTTKVLWIARPADEKEIKAANSQHQLEATKTAEMALQTDALANIAEQLAAIRLELAKQNQTLDHYHATLTAAIQLALDCQYRPTEEEPVPL
jgi:hypothetical protein